jgi:peptide deformylase
MLLKIRSVGDPVLRQVARSLSPEEIRSTEIKSLIRHMQDTVRDAPGVGLAAPQIGESIRLTVIEDRPEYQKTLSEAELKERERKPIKFHAIFNPTIELLTPSEISFFEGCLSIPWVMAKVRRARSVRVTCLDEQSNPRIIEAHGWYARILQHEIDHLNGVLYTDRMEGETLTTLEHYQRQSKNAATDKSS